MNTWETQRRQDNYQNSQGLDSLYMLRENTYSYNTTPSTTNMAQLRSLPQSQKLVDLVKSGTQSSSSGNNTGIPTQMKEDFEAKSGFSFDDVKVHYNSDKPAQLQALAYTQGNQVYVGPGQEKHLLHELGHVAQQKQGIVKPTTQVNGVPVNDDPEMEASADCYGVLGNLSPVQMVGNPASNEIVQMFSDKDGRNVTLEPVFEDRHITGVESGHTLVNEKQIEEQVAQKHLEYEKEKNKHWYIAVRLGTKEWPNSYQLYDLGVNYTIDTDSSSINHLESYHDGRKCSVVDSKKRESQVIPHYFPALG